ncbi:LysR family transcriptional regulator [Paenibacillus methanolicus]|uniref:DNA-binding transcriptional LysR family regulator n=1 Tax=Paenibacillus methanolicus TaxID=582686 RepID=A0A5S5C269_9BACL|nr:LysR family transcriptional regulator [Paenibacillus methanolicus]TYP73397.1 DNA-binding transcriptional LysR family regulator [Paenibacillus methanolicus]
MELLQLQYFRTVARLEHMTKAAQELRVAQPALSKTIARLEKDVGVPLFDREGRQIRLNAFGKAFLTKVEAALLLLEEGQREVADLAGLEHGSIHLATSTLDRLSDPLNAFVALHPQVNFRITQGAMCEMAQLTEAGEVDLCFTPMPLARTNFSAVSVLREDVYLAVPPGHRLAGRKSVRLNEAEGEPFIGYQEGFHFQQMNDAFFREAGFAPNFVCRVDEAASIAKLVSAGLGVALVGNCGGAQTRLNLLAIESPACQRHFRFIWNDKRYLSKAAREFRDFVVAYFANEEKSVASASR